MLKTRTHQRVLHAALGTLCYMTTSVPLDIDAIGRRAAARREFMRMEQEDVATKAGMSRAYISRLENGGVRNPKVVDLAAVAAALGMSLDALIYGNLPDADLPALLIRRLGPRLGSAVARLDQALASIQQGDIDAATVILERISEHRGQAKG